MDKQVELTENGAPIFDGTNYVIWSIRMRVFLKALGFEVLQSIENGYIVPTTPPIDPCGKSLSESNVKAKNVILSG